MAQRDVIEYGPPPPEGEGGAFGATTIRAGERFGVQLMLKGWGTIVDESGEQIAYVRITTASAVQAVQAIRQAIADATPTTTQEAAMSVVDIRVTNGWKIDAEWQRQLAKAVDGWPDDVPQPRCVRRGLLAALVGREPIGGVGEPRWHISVQHRDRVPNWDELVLAAHDLRPGVVFVIGLPPRSWWLNKHPNVLHLWETIDDGLVAEYRANARGDQPT